jgi:putative tricarboxylic transport membrane protein
LIVLLCFGVFGYVFRKLQYDVASFILAMILGPMMEMTFRQSLMRSAGSFSIFWESPISFVLIVVSGLLLLWNIYRELRPAQAAWENALQEGR